jgi:hypothetical protein
MWGVVVLAVIGLICYGAYSLFVNIGGAVGEQEGYVKSDDCRETVLLQEDTAQKYFKQFTCTYIKTRSGKILGGTCAHVVMDGSPAYCKTVYTYQKPSQINCSDPKFPFAGTDDLCHAVPQ